MLDTGSSSYKKARKQYLKSNRNRTVGSSADWTPFRAAEKKYMAKFPPPDLSDVLDLALLDEGRRNEVDRGKWKGSPDAIGVREVTLKGNAENRRKRVYCIPQLPGTSYLIVKLQVTRRLLKFPLLLGLVILPGYLDHELQRHLIRWSLTVHARRPNETNLDAHYRIPAEGLWNLHARCDITPIPRRDYDSTQAGAKTDNMSGPTSDSPPDNSADHGATSPRPRTPSAQQVTHRSATASELLPKLRWANIGWFYNWGTKEYEFERGKPDVGEPTRSICKEIVRLVDWSEIFGTSERYSDTDHEMVAISSEWAGWDTSYGAMAFLIC